MPTRAQVVVEVVEVVWRRKKRKRRRREDEIRELMGQATMRFIKRLNHTQQTVQAKSLIL